MSLLNTFKNVLTSGMVDKLASLVGGNSSVIKTGLTTALPSIIRGIVSKGSTASGAGQLLDLIKNNKLTGDMTPDASLMEKGAKINESIFGSALKDINIPGVSGDSRSGLLNAVTPLLMGKIGKVVSDKNLDAAGLSSYLGEQGAGLGDKATGAVKSAAGNVRNMTSNTADAVGGAASSGLGFLKWLLPLLLIGGLAFWLLNKGGGDGPDHKHKGDKMEHKADMKKGGATHTHSDGTVHKGDGHDHGHSTTSATTTTTTSGKVTSTTGTAVSTGMAKAEGAAMEMKDKMMGLSLDADGNLMKDGEMFMKKGEFTVKDGEYFDGSGKSLGVLAKVGKAMGDAGKAVGGAVSGAAGKTADFFKDTFGGMFKSKSAGTAVSAYTLSNITFDPSSHKITNFSKNEVQGLAAALKNYPDAKITVNAIGDDKGVAKKRAQVIHDMLVTLGVADKQINAKGATGRTESYQISVD